jgi:NAD(P)-dependent dehydrogenase (short-subunit alcohol dehydrogenase family)
VAAVSALASFPAPFAAAVIGASGGIGGALVRALAVEPGVARVHALSRTPAAFGLPLVREGAIDLDDDSSIADAAASLAAEAGAPLRLVVIATGALHGQGLAPEKRLADLDRARLSRAFMVNAIGPALVLKAFAPLLAREGRVAAAALSARVGSIADNRLGGWHGYRASKAALNMLVRNAAIELARRNPDSVALALHPGTVATALSQPWTGGGEGAVAPEVAAANLLAVIGAATPERSGRLIAWDGADIPT